MMPVLDYPHDKKIMTKPAFSYSKNDILKVNKPSNRQEALKCHQTIPLKFYLTT